MKDKFISKKNSIINDMEGLIVKVLRKNLFMSLFFLIVGIILLIWPVKSTLVITYIIGVCLICNGILCLFDYDKRFHIFDPIIIGIMSLLFGMVIIINPDIFTYIIPILLGFWIVIVGVIKCRLGVILKNFNDGDWLLVVVMSLVSVFCGVLLMMFPNLGAVSITFLVGAILIVYSLDDIINYTVIRKRVGDIAKALKDR